MLRVIGRDVVGDMVGTDECLFDGLADDGEVEGTTDALIDGLAVDGDKVGTVDRLIVGRDADGDLVGRDEGLPDDFIVGFIEKLIDGLAVEDGRAMDDVVVGRLEGLFDGREVDDFTVGATDTDIVLVTLEGAAVILVLLVVGFTVPTMLGPLLDGTLIWQGRRHTLSNPQMADGLQHPFVAHPQLFTVMQLPVDDE